MDPAFPPRRGEPVPNGNAFARSGGGARAHDGVFATTRWSIVVAADGSDSEQARGAIEFLCGAYWWPVYCEVRRRGHAPADAQDHTQEFFARVLRDHSFAGAQRERGRFRSFLLGALKHYLADAHDRASAQKRGGGLPPIAFDAMDAEQRLACEPAGGESPEMAFDRRWATVLVERALAQLGKEQETAGKGAQWKLLRPFIGGSVEAGEYAPLEAPLGLTANAIAACVRRLRHRAREIIVADVTHTLSNPADAEAELRSLFS